MLLFGRRITLLPILINKEMLSLLTKEDKEMALLTIVPLIPSPSNVQPVLKLPWMGRSFHPSD